MPTVICIGRPRLSLVTRSTTRTINSAIAGPAMKIMISPKKPQPAQKQAQHQRHQRRRKERHHAADDHIRGRNLVVARPARLAIIRAQLAHRGHHGALAADRPAADGAVQPGLAIGVAVAVLDLGGDHCRLGRREQRRGIAGGQALGTPARWLDLHALALELLDIAQAGRDIAIGRLQLQRALEILALLGQDRHHAAEAGPCVGACRIQLGRAAEAGPRRIGVARQRRRAPLLDELLNFGGG